MHRARHLINKIALYVQQAVPLRLNMNAELYWETRVSSSCFQTRVSSYNYDIVKYV